MREWSSILPVVVHLLLEQCRQILVDDLKASPSNNNRELSFCKHDGLVAKKRWQTIDFSFI